MLSCAFNESLSLIQNYTRTWRDCQVWLIICRSSCETMVSVCSHLRPLSRTQTWSCKHKGCNRKSNSISRYISPVAKNQNLSILGAKRNRFCIYIFFAYIQEDTFFEFLNWIRLLFYMNDVINFSALFI